MHRTSRPSEASGQPMGIMFLKPEDPYYPNWVNMRQRTRAAWFAIALWLPTTFLFSGVLRLIFGLDGSFFWAALPTTCIVIVFRVYQTTWPCPRCGRSFYWTCCAYWGFTSCCLHCRLPEYAPHGEYGVHRSATVKGPVCPSLDFIERRGGSR